MDEFSSRKTAGGLSYTRKASSGLALRDSSENGDRNTRICSRVGCSSRMNSTKGNQIGGSSIAKNTRHPIHSLTSGKEVVGSSSKTPSPRKSISEQNEASQAVTKPDSAQGRLSALVQSNVSGGSSSISQSRHGKKTMRRSELGIHDSSSGGVKDGAGSSKYKFRNLKCNSINDVVPSASSELNLDRKRLMGRKRFGEAEGSSSAKGKKINGPLLDDGGNNNSSHRGICISNSRRTRNSPFARENDSSAVGTQRSTEEEDRSKLRQTESSDSTPLLPQPGLLVDTNALGSEDQGDASRRRANVYGNRSLAPSDVGFGSSLRNRENVGQYSLDGIAEMLLALDRIEQDEDLNYEQLLVLETNLFLSGLGFHDQHREMRLDIDNMSYEELLALEDRMGTVSTALTEEDIGKCLKNCIYHSSEGTVSGNEEYDTKCSICQEEYKEGSNVGKLSCQHQYHVECAKQWLRLKNWCPICKASAAP